MLLLWNIPAGNPAYDALTYHRWMYVLCSIEGLSMAIVLVRTYYHTKYPYLYTIAFLIFLSAGFRVLAFILNNWGVFCP
jgi:hypothetical protein